MIIEVIMTIMMRIKVHKHDMGLHFTEPEAYITVPFLDGTVLGQVRFLLIHGSCLLRILLL